MSRLTDDEKQAMCRFVMRASGEVTGLPPEGLCVPAAGLLVRLLRGGGELALLQAGSASWRCVNADDDGVGFTHFSYVWEPASAVTRAKIAAGELPELHAWVGVLNQDGSGKWLIDPTTGAWPDQLERTLGLSWRGARPPKYLWHDVAIPQIYDCEYWPEREACLLAERKWLAWWRDFEGAFSEWSCRAGRTRDRISRSTTW